MTLRTTAKVGLSELDKLISGYGDYLFYGFAADTDRPSLSRWLIVDLSRLRLYLHRCFRELDSENIRYGWKTMRNGDSFLWVDLSLVHPQSGIVVDRGRDHLSVYNASRGTDQMFSGKDDHFARLKAVVEPLQCYVIYEEHAKQIASRIEQPLPTELGDILLYNVAYTESGSPLLCVEGQSYCEFDENSNEIPTAILAMESESRQRVLKLLRIPTIRVDRSMEVLPNPGSRYELWQYLAQDAAVNTLLKRDGTKLKLSTKHLGYPVAGWSFIGKDENFYHFDIANMLFSRGNPFDFLVIDDELVRKGRGFDASWMRLFRATADFDGSTISMAVCAFSDGSQISGFARIPELEPIFLRANARCLAEALACARMKTRCEEIRRAEAAPDDVGFISRRIEEVSGIGSTPVTLTSTADYETYVNRMLK
ncbi:MAG: hypothetical protein WB681_03095 [Candidatus Cybelea sp.]